MAVPFGLYQLAVSLEVGGLVTASVDGFFKCSFCPCVFVCQSDLDLHLKAFGNKQHERFWRCIHILAVVDAHNAGVDSHGDWSGRTKRDKHLSHPNAVKACRDLVRAERSDVSDCLE